MLSKRAVYLLPRGRPTTTPAPLSTPTVRVAAAAPRGSVPVALPIAKMQSGLPDLPPGSPVRVVLVVGRDTGDGRILHEPMLSDGATLLDVLDSDGVPLDRPYRRERAATVRVAVPRGLDDATIAAFVGALADAGAIYLLATGD